MRAASICNSAPRKARRGPTLREVRLAAELQECAAQQPLLRQQPTMLLPLPPLPRQAPPLQQVQYVKHADCAHCRADISSHSRNLRLPAP